MKLFALIPLLTLSLFAQESPRWTYQEQIDGEVIQTNWYVKEESGNTLILEGVSPKTTLRIECSPNYEAKKISYLSNKESSGNESHCYREGSQLKAEKVSGSEKMEKSHFIGNSPWVQEFGFGLRTFAQSSEREYKFNIINPKDLTLNKMVAKKERLETLTIGNTAYTAQKVKITLQGVKSVFWTAYAWFDTKSGDLLMYRGNKGPNTPTSTITLVTSEVASPEAA